MTLLTLNVRLSLIREPTLGCSRRAMIPTRISSPLSTFVSGIREEDIRRFGMLVNQQKISVPLHEYGGNVCYGADIFQWYS